MAAQVDVRFLRRNQEELGIRLRFQRAEIRVELVEPKIGEIGGMTVSVEVHDHRRIDAHGFQHGFEWRRPVEAVRHRLHGVGEMPMRAQRLVAGKCGKSIAIGVAQHVRQRRLGRPVRQEKEHAHALRPSRRGIHPWVVLPVFVPELTHADAHASAPSAMPDVREVRREIARKEILMRSREHRHAPPGRLCGKRTVPRFHRFALGLQAVVDLTLQRARGVE